MDRASWLAAYHRFMIENGTRVERLPIFDREPLDIYRLYHAVIGRGGLECVTTQKLWRQVTQDLNVDPDRTDAGFRLRVHYTKFLYPFEAAFFNAGNAPAYARQQQSRQPMQRSSFVVDSGAPPPPPPRPSSLLYSSQTLGGRSSSSLSLPMRSVVVAQSDGESNDNNINVFDQLDITPVSRRPSFAVASSSSTAFNVDTLATAVSSDMAFATFGNSTTTASTTQPFNVPTISYSASTLSDVPLPNFVESYATIAAAAPVVVSRKRSKLVVADLPSLSSDETFPTANLQQNLHQQLEVRRVGRRRCSTRATRAFECSIFCRFCVCVAQLLLLHSLCYCRSSFRFVASLFFLGIFLFVHVVSCFHHRHLNENAI